MSPNDVRRLARHLGVTDVSLFRTHLAFDFWSADSVAPGTWVVAPANVKVDYGDDWPVENVSIFASFIGDYGAAVGRCRQLTKDGLCAIHDAKPLECRTAVHADDDGAKSWHSRIARAWSRPASRRYMEALRTALGKDPAPPCEPAYGSDDSDYDGDSDD